MKVYQAAKYHDKNPCLEHFGQSILISMLRISSMFCDKNRIGYDTNGKYIIYDIYTGKIQPITIENLLIKFFNFAKQFTIQEYELDRYNDLRVVDYWEDDPIGSVGLMLIDPKYVSKNDIDNLKNDLSIYLPYLGVNMPNYQPNQKLVSEILKKRQNDSLFQRELLKRKQRATILSLNFYAREAIELVWLESTFIIKNWAENLGFDIFSYENHSESNGELCFIPLDKHNLVKTNKIFHLSEKYYFKKVISNLNFILKNRNVHQYDGRYFLWGFENPIQYWQSNKINFLSKLFK
ncbi:hypothetical protein [Suttonella ornithocola]|uniref:Uncharacterized protein n=1 Tax=Suttonella ornithocola TaxID=279832 RepID=A0A380MXR3_9GAMM|nr:hypothetical protein [Suttonella ornithocola]SUO97380.1 Uncharacterised protein [Suttonella ornithocola]